MAEGKKRGSKKIKKAGLAESGLTNPHGQIRCIPTFILMLKNIETCSGER